MKILFTISYYTPYVSGLTICAQRLAEGLAKRGHKVEVLAAQHTRSLPKQEVLEKVSVKRVSYWFAFSKGLFMPSYVWHASRMIWNTDVVVINSPQSEEIVAAILSFLLRKRLYCIYHCEVRLPQNFINSIIQFLLPMSHSIVFLLSHKIVTYTKDFAKYSKLLPYFSKKLVTIYPPILIPTIDEKAKKNLRAIIPQNKKYIIGLAVRIAAEKGIEYLLQAIPSLQKTLGDDFVILIAGPKHPVGEEKYWETINPLIVQYKKYVCFLGTLSSSEMGSFYSLLDILVLPSVNSTEAFGMVQVEAMFCAVPVVASDLPGVRVPVRLTGMGELAAIKDPQDLAEKICAVLRSKKKYVKDKKHIAKLFSFDESIALYEKLFTGIS